MKGIKQIKIDFYLAAIALVSAFLNGYNIWHDKYANTYYTMAVGSMLQSFSNFFFGSLDSAGSVTVDKPPLTFWIQTAFAYVFGLHGWSVILPQALAGVGSVLLVYAIVKPTFGVAAARIASLALALTPVLASVSRTNNIDSMLVFALLVGTWLLFKGIRGGRTGMVIGAFAMIGVAFNMKMLQAYMALPAFYLFYVLAARVNWKRKAAVLAGATALMMVISVSWAVIVDSIPADNRPYIGSSEKNSVLELAFGYNGVSRLTGDQAPGGGGGMGGGRGDGGGFQRADGGGNGTTTGQVANGASPAGDDGTGNANGTAPTGDGTGGANGGFPGQGGGFGGGGGFQGGGPGGGGAGGSFGTGAEGPLRLFQSGLSGEASWLIPFAFFGCIALLASFRRRSFTQKHKETIFWLAWLVPGMMFFSVAGFFHQYYLIMLAAPLAALVGAGWQELWTAYRRGEGWMSYLLPVSITATAALQWYIMQSHDDTIGKGWSIGVAAAGVLTTMLLFTLKGSREIKFSRVIGTVSVFVMLIGPAYWALTPITYGQSSMTPIVGPDSSDGFGGGGRGGNIPAMGGIGGMMPGQDGQTGQDDQSQFPQSADTAAGQGTNGQGTDGQSQSGQNGQLPQNAGTDGQSAPNGQNAQDPGAAPNFAGGMPTGMGGGQGSGSVNATTLAYLKEHNTGEKYLFATFDYGTAAPYIIDDNEKVVSMGGFSGSDPAYSVEKLQKLVESGQLKYFMISGGGFGRGGSSDVTTWITEHGTVIPTSEWQGGTASGTNAGTDATDSNATDGGRSGGFRGMNGGATLYEVKL